MRESDFCRQDTATQAECMAPAQCAHDSFFCSSPFAEAWIEDNLRGSASLSYRECWTSGM